MRPEMVIGIQIGIENAQSSQIISNEPFERDLQ